MIIRFDIRCSERLGATGRTIGPDGVQWRGQNDAVELVDFPERPERDGDRCESHQRRTRQQHTADGRFRVRPATRPVHRHAHRPGTLNLPGARILFLSLSVL